MSLNWKDTERMADDVEKLAGEIGEGYQRMGMEVPPPMRLIMQAHCAWTHMLIMGVREREQEQRAAARKEQAAKPTIILPTGVRPIR